MGSIGIFVNNGSGRVCETFDLADYTQLSMDDKDCCGGGMLLQDADISVVVLLLQMIFVCYVFLGVALGADAFMGSIEVITSKETLNSTQNEKGDI